MTEERMIRFIKPESLDGKVGIRIFFDYYLPNRQLAKDGFNVKDFDDLEPAPPKDWKPTCWGNIPYCTDKIMPIPKAIVFESCQECPFRK